MTKQEKIDLVMNNFNLITKSNWAWSKQEVIDVINNDINLDSNLLFEINPYVHGNYYTYITLLGIVYNKFLKMHQLYYFYKFDKGFYIYNISSSIINKYKILLREKKLNILLNE